MQYRQSCPVRDKIMRRYDQQLLGAPLWCTTQQEEGLWIQGVNVIVPQRWVFVCTSELALDESLSHQHMGVMYHRGRSLSASTSMIGAAGELDYFSAHIRLRETGQSDDKAECKAMDNSAMGLAVPWYRRGETSVESSIPCSHGRRALVVKGDQGGRVCNGKLQVPRQGGRAEAKELHKTSVDGLLIKIAKIEGLRVDAGVLDQGTK
ncbi:hypothetical protein GW17_00020128 [Ensete ventricosum]|uniref:Uncharacterized protein n=1 Tax=Ensete ventricosum TaxID=4639 RepID=A0A444F047_ENSVE|nr:hypothetical protein GW17_00020128 [Ensete ventricosum]RZR72892.1 hypothetical protein BHM03_00018329 [Ensete ventricosum]